MPIRSCVTSFTISAAASAALAASMVAAHPEGAAGSSFQALYSFCAVHHCTDGAGAYGNPLIVAPSGTLYGTTSLGGAWDWGTVFAMVPNAKKTGYRHDLLYNFCSVGDGSCTDGAYPATGVVRDTAGNLYGTTVNGGGHLKGEVFRLDLNGRKPKLDVLYAFCAKAGCSDGDEPGYLGTLTYAGAASGAPYDGVSPLYGTTIYGGTHGAAPGGGIVFSVTPGPRGWTEHVLYDFCAAAACTDGRRPDNVVLDRRGNLFGITVQGGAQDHGAIFELAHNGKTWTETVLHDMCSMAGCKDGDQPSGPPILDGAGRLLGVTAYGGTNDDGVLYQVTPNGTQSRYEVLHSFCSVDECADGAYPYGSIVLDESGTIFGATSYGVDEAATGTVYRFSGGVAQVLYNFCVVGGCPDGNVPLDGVALDGAGHLFGMTTLGGAHGGGGVVYEITP